MATQFSRIIRPTSTEVGWASSVPVVATDQQHTLVDDVVPVDSRYILSVPTGDTAAFKTGPVPGAAGVLQSVTLRIRARADSAGTCVIRPRLYTGPWGLGHVEIIGALIELTTTVTDYDRIFTSGPGGAWDWAMLSDLGFAIVKGAGVQARVTNLYGTVLSEAEKVVVFTGNITRELDLTGNIARETTLTGNITRAKSATGNITRTRSVTGNITRTWSKAGRI
jgi:hypothetical protein